MRNAFTYHIVPFILAIGLCVMLVFLTSPLRNKDQAPEYIECTGEQVKIKGRHGNLLAGEQSEIDFMASLKNPEQLTVLGSSEFSDSQYTPYNFFPDSLGIPALGLGHAYHQEFSMVCELLAGREYLKDSKICVILSPGWFRNGEANNENGTNIEAFLEFVRPNFIDKIASDSTIDQKYKSYIGRYIHNHYDDISSPSSSMKILLDAYLEKNGNVITRSESKLSRHIMGNHRMKIPSYSITLKDSSMRKAWDGNWDHSLKYTQEEFKKLVTNNKLYVYDEYYSKNLVEPDGTEKHSSVDAFELEYSREFNDFELLVELFKEYNVDASFVIQPLNPYYYDNLENYNELVAEVMKTLDKNKIPYLNLFVDNKKDYKVGTLKDVMHLGDYGWMQINRFLNSIYYE